LPPLKLLSVELSSFAAAELQSASELPQIDHNPKDNNNQTATTKEEIVKNEQEKKKESQETEIKKDEECGCCK